MKKIILTSLLVLPLLCFAQYTYKNLAVNYENDATAKNYTYKNLRLYPIRAKESFKQEFRNVGKYMPLKDAIEKKKVVITEKGNGGTVNTLTIQNVSQDTIIVIVGEVIKGGKQDRIINQDIVLPPNSKKMDLSVFCVEAGRWSASAKGHQFESYNSVGSLSLRKVVEKEAQQGKVWDEVDKLNSKNKTSTSTKTYTAMNNSADYKKQLAEYTNYFKEKLSKEENVIGVVIVSGDKVLGCDMFATAELFRQNVENLLSSYATEAILNGNTVNIKTDTVKGYLDNLLSDERKQEETLREKGKSFSDKGKKLRVSSYD
jgi:hypothetical protein